MINRLSLTVIFLIHDADLEKENYGESMSTLKLARREGNQCRSLQGGEMLDRDEHAKGRPYEPGDRKSL